MQTVKTSVRVEVDRTVTVQLPDEVQTGEYEMILVLSSRSQTEAEAASSVNPNNSESTLDDAWEAWVQEVEQMPLSPTPTEGEYQQHLIEKYQKQGLDL